MPNDWKIAKARPRRKPKPPRVPYVSINKRGEIAMNAAAFRQIREPGSVTLLYDAEANRIGIKYPVARDGNFFPVRRYGRGRKMRIVRAMRLLKQFGIKITQTQTFPNCQTQTLNGHPMLVLELCES